MDGRLILDHQSVTTCKSESNSLPNSRCRSQKNWMTNKSQQSAIASSMAWCLMGNHVHLLIQENDEPIGDTMKRIASSYVYYYNHKYDRIGHLFQERFKSQPVESWGYFLTLLRYIHQNPLKPHLVSDLKDYPWSSWREYLGISQPPFTSIQTVLRRIDISELTALIEKPMDKEEEDGLLDAYVQPKAMSYNNEQVWDMIEYYCGANTPSQFRKRSIFRLDTNLNI